MSGASSHVPLSWRYLVEKRTISFAHEKLARAFSKKAHDSWIVERDLAIREFYLNYGLHETVKEMGWTKPTILTSVQNAEKTLTRTNRKK